MANTTPKKRTLNDVYQGIKQISDDENIDFGLDNMTEEDFVKKYKGKESELYDALSGISDDEGVDFGIGTKEEWTGSFSRPSLAQRVQAAAESGTFPFVGSVGSQQGVSAENEKKPLWQMSAELGMQGRANREGVQRMESIKKGSALGNAFGGGKEPLTGKRYTESGEETNELGQWYDAQKNNQQRKAEADFGSNIEEQFQEAERKLHESAERDRQRANENESALDYLVAGMQDPNVMTGPKLPEDSEETKERRAIYNALKEADKIVKAAQYSEKHNGWQEFWKSFGKKIGDWETWDMGVSSMLNNGTALRVIKKLEAANGDETKLTDSERDLLDALATQAVVEQYYHDHIGKGYNLGSGVAESVPFMAEMIINPMSGAGSATGKALGKYILKRFGVKGTMKGVMSSVKNKAWKQAGKELAGTVVRDVASEAAHLAGSAGMASTTGLANVIAGSYDRQIGKVTGNIGLDGSVDYTGRQQYEANARKAFWKEWGSRTIENFSESGMGAANEAVGDVTTRLIGKMFKGSTAKMVSKAYNGWRKFKKGNFGQVMKRAQWQGMVPEWLEEVEGGIANAIVVGDQTLDTDPETGVFNPGNMWDTFLQVAATSMMIGGGHVASYGIGKGAEAWSNANRLRQSDKEGQTVFGVDGWDDVKQAVEGAVRGISEGKDGIGLSEEGKAAMRGLMEGRSQDEKQAIVDYFGARVKSEVSSAMIADETMTDDERELQNDYSRGYEAMMQSYDEDSEDSNQRSMLAASDMAIERDQKRTALAERIGEKAVSELEQSRLGGSDIDDQLARMVDEGKIGEGDMEAVKDYMKTHAAYRGVEDFVNEAGDAVSRQARMEMAPTRDEQGNVRTATMKNGKTLYIKGGEVKVQKDGTIDTEGSTEALTAYDPEEEKNVFVNVDDIESMEEKGSDEVEREIEQQGSDFKEAMLNEINGVNTLGVGKEVTAENGMRGIVVAEDADNYILQMEDGQQVAVNKEQYEQELQARRMADYEQRHGSTTAEVEEEVREETPEGTETTEEVPSMEAAEGAPEEYTPGMQLTLRDEDGNERQAAVLTDVRFELTNNGQFVESPEGRYIALSVEGEDGVVYKRDDILNKEVVRHEGEQPADAERTEVPEESLTPTLSSEGEGNDVTSEAEPEDAAQVVYDDIKERYGEKAEHKIEVTVKDRQANMEAKRKALVKAQQEYDDAPIGKEEKAEKAVTKAQQEYEEAQTEYENWREVKSRKDQEVLAIKEEEDRRRREAEAIRRAEAEARAAEARKREEAWREQQRAEAEAERKRMAEQEEFERITANRIDVEDRAEERSQKLAEAKNLRQKEKIAKEIYGEMLGEMGETTDQFDTDVYEYVAAHMPKNLRWDGPDGLQKEIGSNKKRGIGKQYESNMFNQYLAPNGQGTKFGDAVHNLWRSEVNQKVGGNLDARYTEDEIRDALLDLLLNEEDIEGYVLNHRIEVAEAEKQAEENRIATLIEDEWIMEHDGLTKEEYYVWVKELEARAAAVNGMSEEEYYKPLIENEYDNKQRETNHGTVPAERAGEVSDTGSGNRESAREGEREEGEPAGVEADGERGADEQQTGVAEAPETTETPEEQYKRYYEEAEAEIAEIESQLDDHPSAKNDKLIDHITEDMFGVVEDVLMSGGTVDDVRLKARYDAAEKWMDENIAGTGPAFQKAGKKLSRPTKEQKELTKGVVEVLKETGVPTHYVTKKGQEMLDKYKEQAQKQKGEPVIFYSNAERAVEGIKQEKATAEQWLKMIEKNGGLKAGEDKWTGLSEWLKSNDKKSLTKQQVMDYIRENQIQVEEVNYGVGLQGEAQEKLDEFNREYKEYLDQYKKDAEPSQADLEAFEQEMLDKYGEGWANVYNIKDQARHDELVERVNNSSEPHEAAFKAMVDQYGDDFESAFEINYANYSVDGSSRLVPQLDYYDGIADAAKYFLGMKEGATNPINETRLRYTTDGLDNKREIALVVPTIESWNEDDQVHFGDAGEGRAVAWVRFGETTDADGKKVLVIDEIQSKRHQEGREKGYVSSEQKERHRKLGEDVKKAEKEYNDYTADLWNKYKDSSSSVDEMLSNITEEEGAKVEELRDRYNKLSEEWSKDTLPADAIPDAPFEKNWHELAMKRMLRYAAENGYDKVAWTKGEQQAERYDLGGVVKTIGKYNRRENEQLIEIEMQDGKRYTALVDSEGNVIESNHFPNAKTLSDIIGKEMANKALSLENGGEISGEGLSIGGEGMKGFYDQMLPRYMDKYGKKWGVKTDEVRLDNIGDNGLTMWSVDVTPEMRESVMEGQPMFFKTEDGEVLGYTLNGEIYIDPRVATPDTPIHEYTHLWAQGLRSSNPTAWAQLTEEMKGVEDGRLWEYVRGRYPELKNEDELTEEVFAHYSGKRGRERLEADMREEMSKTHDVFEKAKVATMFHKLREILSNFWNMARDLFAGKVEGIENLTAEDFADMVLGDLARGYNPVRARTEQSKALDNEYMEAVKRGDMETAQRMVNEAAERAGYTTDEDYKMTHTAPNGRDGFSKSIDDPSGLYPDDLYSPNGARYYGDGEEWMDRASAAIFRRVHNNPDAMVKVYRAVPKSLKETKLRNGDWVSINREYAKEHGERNINGGYKIIEDEVPAKYVYTDANSLHEQGYDDGNDYAYQNTKNNRKLLDAVTYDDNGNVIPLSKRFNKRNADVRYHFGERETFNDRQQKAAADKGTVMPGLADVEVTIVDVPKHSFKGTGKQAIQSAENWAKENIIGEHTAHKGESDEYDYMIDNDAISKFLSGSSTTNSENLGVHLAVLTKLLDVIDNSIEVEVHPDYKKVNGKRKAENGIENNDMLVHRIYGAVNIDGKTYRVKTTMHEFNDGTNKPHDYRVTKIELIESGSSTSDAPINSISGAKLLKDVEKSYDKSKNILSESTKEQKDNALENNNESDILFREETDEEVIERLEREPKVKVYRAMQLIDGELYPPMSAKVNGELRQPTKLGVWERADENPDMADENGKFTLNKGNGKSLKAAYNPYIHTSATMLNDQFSEAQSRPNLVVVEMEVPESEVEGDYRAEKAKDTVGRKQWKAGVIQGQLSGTREVILSRWAKPVRIVPDAEVAESIARQIEGQVPVMPSNVVTPQVREEMEKLGVQFVETDNTGKLKEGENAGKTWASVFGKGKSLSEVTRIGEGPQVTYTPYDEALKEAKKAGYTKAQFDRHIERVWKQRKKTAERFAEKLNLGDRVNVVLDIDELEGMNLTDRQKRAKGWYDTKTGKIYVIMDNNTGMDDVFQTILHEGVAHHGLRELFGENFDTFLDDVYAHSTEDIRREIASLSKKYNWNVRTATEEYMAKMAETQNFEHPQYESWWRMVKDWFIWMVKKIGMGDWIGNHTITENELRFVLWRSWKNLTEPEGNWGYVRQAQDIAMQAELGVGEYADKAPYGRDWKVEKPREEVPAAASGDVKYDELKAQVPDKVIMMKNGELYEIKGEDAKTAAQLLGLPTGEDGVLRIPEDMMEKSLSKLVRSGKKVAIAEPIKGKDIARPTEKKKRNQAAFPNDKEKDDAYWSWVEALEDEKYSLSEAKELLSDAQKRLETAKGVSRSILEGKVAALKPWVDFMEDPDNQVAEDGIMLRDGEEELEGKEEDIWKDKTIGMQERLTAAKLRMAEQNKESLETVNEAVKAVGENLYSLRIAMNLQKMYDRQTVKSVSDLARIMMQYGYMEDMNKGEVKRLLSAVKNATGKTDVTKEINTVMDIMTDNMLRRAETMLKALEKVKASKVDAKGVEVQGKLDVQGQQMLKAFKETRGYSEQELEEAMANAQEKMGSDNAALADEAANELAGLQIALDYVQKIHASRVEERELRKELAEAKGRELKEALEEAIRQNKIERVQAYAEIVESLSGKVGESVLKAKANKEAEIERVREIQHNANSDMEGRPSDEHYKPKFADKFVNNSFVQTLFAPLSTFEQMLRLIGNKSANGEGYLYNRFVRGWVDARQKEIRGVRGKYEMLDAKAREIFGKGVKNWGDVIRLSGRMPKMDVEFMDGGELKSHTLTQGNLMYIYMVNKMVDGRMKLRKMGVGDEAMRAIEERLDPRMKELADWLQGEFLVETRNEYNETHKRMFGASMAAIEDYFPLKILKNARVDKAEELDNPNQNEGISTSTGSIIKRRRNALALDLTGADALNVILDHVAQMEHWNAFAEYNRDLNTLRTYKHFRNQVKNMKTIYGSGEVLWKKFNDLCQMASGSYIPPRSKFDEAALNFAKGVTAAKVSFRVFTAMKQFLSFPAYFSEARPDLLAKNLATPWMAWQWGMKNLPIFEERWKGKMAGDPRLLKSEMDWKMWRNNIVQMASKVGMSPNAFVDALTVSIGAHAVYETRKARYLKEGYSEEQAERRAIQDAEIAYNQTQQSSEGAFLSTMQVDRSWLSVMFTVFRNASMAYMRQLHDAVRNLKRSGLGLNKKYRAESIEFTTKQLIREGVEPEKARKAAETRFARQQGKDALRVGIFGYVLQWCWNMGPYLPYLLMGDDDDEKKKMWNDVWTHTAFGWLEGLTGGDVISSAGNMLLSGEGNPEYLSKDMPLESDIMNIMKKLGSNKKTEALTDVIDLVVQSGIGMNPQSITDGVLAIMDACGNDAELAREASICIMRILQFPQSQIDKIYFDEVGLNGSEVSEYTPAQLARRYAEYKVKRGHMLTPWKWDDAELIDKQEKNAQKKIKERVDKFGGEEVNEAYEAIEAEVTPMAERVKAANKATKSDYMEGAEMWDKIWEEEDAYMKYKAFKNLDKNLDELVKAYLQSETPEDAEKYQKAIGDYKKAMVEAIQAYGTSDYDALNYKASNLYYEARPEEE